MRVGKLIVDHCLCLVSVASLSGHDLQWQSLGYCVFIIVDIRGGGAGKKAEGTASVNQSYHSMCFTCIDSFNP